LTEIDNELVQNRILLLEENLGNLHELQSTDQNDFFSDFRIYNAAEHLLQVNIDIMIDITAHLVSRLFHSMPEDAAQLFVVLAENQLISEDHAHKFAEMIHFRNILVHHYVKVDLNLVYSYLQDELGDFDEFTEDIKAILEYANSY